MFRHFDEATAEDWVPINEKFEEFQKGIAGQMIAHLQLLATHDLGYPVDRYVHSLQTATRAMRDGADDEMIVVALLHDIGDTLAPINHGPLAAAMLAPYISKDNAWLIQHHEEFQGYFYAEYFGGDKHAREKYRDHPYFAATAKFTDEWDQKAFDPDYDTLPITAFLPALETVFSREPWSAACEATTKTSAACEATTKTSAACEATTKASAACEATTKKSAACEATPKVSQKA